MLKKYWGISQQLEQRYRIFFFTRAWTLVIHSFKSENRVFFFPRSGKKKYSLFFFFPGKVHRSFIRSFDEFLFFLIKDGCVFFFRNFVVFFCVFFFPGKVHKSFIHSIFWAEKKKQPGKKKKQPFHSFIRKSSKMHKNELFRGNKKIRYLWPNYSSIYNSAELYLSVGRLGRLVMM